MTALLQMSGMAEEGLSYASATGRGVKILLDQYHRLAECARPDTESPRHDAGLSANVAGLAPWNLLTLRPATKAGPIFSVITACPVGLLRSLVISARNLQQEIPADALRSVTSLMQARMSGGREHLYA